MLGVALEVIVIRPSVLCGELLQRIKRFSSDPLSRPLSAEKQGTPSDGLGHILHGGKKRPQPAFSSRTGKVRLCFLTISTVMDSSLIFLLPGT